MIEPDLSLNPIIKATASQIKFTMCEKRYCAFIGGFGCGKSFGVGMKCYWLAERTKGWPGMLISRSGKQLDNLKLELENVFKMMGLTYLDWNTYKKAKTPFSFTLYDGNIFLIYWGGTDGPRKDGETRVYCETTENYAYKRWAGGNRAWAVIDEIDTMQNPAEVWAFANDRVRVGPFNQTACASTPEGFGFLWDFFDQKPKEDMLAADDRAIIRGCTFDNPNINKSYVRSQIMTRDPRTLRAYVFGEFVNLDGTLVYWRFDKDLNKGTKTLKDFPKNFICHVGVDFNKNINAACISIVDHDGTIHVVDECFGATDVFALIEQLKQKLNGRPIKIYPDASGYEGIRQLEREFGSHAVIYDNANPAVAVRVASVNERMFNENNNLPRILVNPQTAPRLYNSLMRQVKNERGEPDKSSGLDHSVDGFGYFVYQNWPAENAGGSFYVHNSTPTGKYAMPNGLR